MLRNKFSSSEDVGDGDLYMRGRTFLLVMAVVLLPLWRFPLN